MNKVNALIAQLINHLQNEATSAGTLSIRQDIADELDIGLTALENDKELIRCYKTGQAIGYLFPQAKASGYLPHSIAPQWIDTSHLERRALNQAFNLAVYFTASSCRVVIGKPRKGDNMIPHVEMINNLAPTLRGELTMMQIENAVSAVLLINHFHMTTHEKLISTLYSQLGRAPSLAKIITKIIAYYEQLFKGVVATYGETAAANDLAAFSDMLSRLEQWASAKAKSEFTLRPATAKLSHDQIVKKLTEKPRVAVPKPSKDQQKVRELLDSDIFNDLTLSLSDIEKGG